MNLKKWISKRYITVVLVGFVLALAIGLIGSLLIHNIGKMIELLGSFLGLGEDTMTYVQIFSQLQTAELNLPSALILVLSTGIALLLFRMWGGSVENAAAKKYRGLRRGTAVLLALLSCVVILLIALWFTDVNGIRFGTVIRFLYNALENGVF